MNFAVQLERSQHVVPQLQARRGSGELKERGASAAAPSRTEGSAFDFDLSATSAHTSCSHSTHLLGTPVLEMGTWSAGSDRKSAKRSHTALASQRDGPTQPPPPACAWEPLPVLPHAESRAAASKLRALVPLLLMLVLGCPPTLGPAPCVRTSARRLMAHSCGAR
jgi:hypothetical protein